MKKGALTQKFFFELVLAVFAVVAFFFIADGFGDQSFYIDERSAREGALNVNALYHVRGNGWLQHPMDMSDKTVRLTSGNFVVQSEIATFSHPSPFVGLIEPTEIANSQKIVVSKNGEKIRLEKEPVGAFHQISCGIQESIRRSQISMHVRDETKDIAASLGFRCDKFGKCIQSDGEERAKVKIVSEDEGITIRFNNNEESKKLACEISNEVTKRTDELTWFLPTDDRELAQVTRGVLIEVENEHQEIVTESLGVVFQ